MRRTALSVSSRSRLPVNSDCRHRLVLALCLAQSTVRDSVCVDSSRRRLTCAYSGQVVCETRNRSPLSLSEPLYVLHTFVPFPYPGIEMCPALWFSDPFQTNSGPAKNQCQFF